MTKRRNNTANASVAPVEDSTHAPDAAAGNVAHGNTAKHTYVAWAKNQWAKQATIGLKFVPKH